MSALKWSHIQVGLAVMLAILLLILLLVTLGQWIGAPSDSGDWRSLTYTNNMESWAVASPFTRINEPRGVRLRLQLLNRVAAGETPFDGPLIDNLRLEVTYTYTAYLPLVRRDYVVTPPPNLVVYPYLGETTPTSVVISWATDGPGAGEVRFSRDRSYSDVVTATSAVYDGKYWHSATLSGLIPATTYQYRVYTLDSDMTPWPEIVFTTAPAPAAARFTFVAFGDNRPDLASSPPTQAALEVAAEMARQRFDLALHTGDIVRSGGICAGEDSVWNQYIRVYFAAYRELIGATPFYPSIGNHELYEGSCGHQGYAAVYDLPRNAPAGDEEEYYSFDWGRAHFVALDTNQDVSAGSPQYNWLLADLQNSIQPWKFVFFHHPPYSAGLHGGTESVRTQLVPLFETYGVDVVFNGHDHDYERTCPILNNACTTTEAGGVVYFVTGAGGAVLRDVGSDWFTAHSARVYHFIKVQLDDCRLLLEAIDRDGSLFDSYEIDRCAD